VSKQDQPDPYQEEELIGGYIQQHLEKRNIVDHFILDGKHNNN